MIKKYLFRKLISRVNHKSYLFYGSLWIWLFLIGGNFTLTWGIDFVSEEEKKEKGAVCELDEQEFTVLSDNHGVMLVHRIFTVYNQNGTKHGDVYLPFTKFVTADKILAEVKTTDGKFLKKLKKEEVKESSLFSRYQLYSDAKEKHFNLTATTFPYVLEYSYEIEYKSLFFCRDWYPQMDIPVRHSVYVLSLPKDFGFKISKRNLPVEPVENKKGGNRQIIFELIDLPSFKEEQSMPPARDCFISVSFVPDRFKIGSYQGSTESWNGFGKWYSTLAEKQYVLSPSNQALFKELVKDCTSAKDTVRALYQFLQRKTRYVAISLGIGGFQPHDAESVLNNGYGDCKDLATLFITMLKVVGIKSYPVLILTQNEGTVLVDFPSNQFNHVIAFVPLEKETFWLDCTCNYCPFGELPWQDEGCQVLVVRDDSSVMVKTPTSSAEENKIHRSIQAELGSGGSLEIKGYLGATGNFESYYREFLNSSTADEKKEWMGRLIGGYAPNFALISYDFEKVSTLDVPFAVGFTAKLIQYPTKSGKDLLLNPNLLSRVDAEDIPKEKVRKYPVDNQYAYTTEDEVTFDFPENLAIKVVPEELNFISPYGSFQTRYRIDGNKLTYKRTKTITRRLIEPSGFEEYKAFLGKIYQADHSFVVLIKTE